MIEKNIKGHKIDKLCQHVSLLKSPNFDAGNIKYFTVSEKRGSYTSSNLL